MAAQRKKRPSARWPRGPQLTDRDVEILRWIATHGVVTAELVARRFFWRPKEKAPGIWACYRRLAALQRLGLILRDKPFAKEPAVLRVTREGARIADVGLRPAPLVLSELRHTLAVVLLAEGLRAQHKAELTTERQLRAERYRMRREGHDTSQGRTPDALLRVPVSAKKVQRIAVELDLSRKDRRAMERMINQYDQEPDVDLIWWYVRPHRLKPAKEVVRQLAAQDRFEVREWPGPT